MTLTVEIDPARRTAAFREVSFLAAGDSCRVVLDGVRGADFGTLKLMLCRDAASESPVASCTSFSQVPNHPSLADDLLALDTAEMAEWFADAVPEESDSDSDSVAPAASVSRREPRLAARASLAERSVRAEGWLVAFDSDRVWAACRVPVLLRPGAGTSGASDPSSIRALVSELVAGLVSAALADKADKVPSASAGNLASLDASGNLADSGATPESIKAAAVTEVVANAPGTMDTLKEIADILGSSQQSGTVLKRIADLESAGGVSVDATLTRQGAAADAKAVGDALRGGFTEWVCDSISEGYDFVSCEWKTVAEIGTGWFVVLKTSPQPPVPPTTIRVYTSGEPDAVQLVSSGTVSFSLSRHLITPTKTSQLENDGDGTNAFVKTNDSRLSDARTPTAHAHAMADVTGLDAALAQKASLSDLPYRLVEPGVWEFSDGGTHTVTGPNEDQDGWVYVIDESGYSQFFGTETEALTALSLTFMTDSAITATRASLPGHLCDRAGNRVVVTGGTTLTLPAAVPGYLRDFLVRLEISGSTVPTITFAAPTGETLTYETDGDEFPVPDEAGDWLYSFTESCVAHKFAVSLKKVNVVAQGGS